MKNLLYLFVVGAFFAFTACGSGSNNTEAATEEVATEVVTDSVTEEAKCCDGTNPECCHGDEEHSHDHEGDGGHSHDHEGDEEHSHEGADEEHNH